MDKLKDVGSHYTVHGSGHYEATVSDNGSVKLETIFDVKNKHSIDLSKDEWQRLVSWVDWQQKDIAYKKKKQSNS